MYPSSCSDGALFGDPDGQEHITKVYLKTASRFQLLDAGWRCGKSLEKLAVGLLKLVFSNQELMTGNCTKPSREDTSQLDSGQLWAIKCMVIYDVPHINNHFKCETFPIGHLDYKFPLKAKEEDIVKLQGERWQHLTLYRPMTHICIIYYTYACDQ